VLGFGFGERRGLLIGRRPRIRVGIGEARSVWGINSGGYIAAARGRVAHPTALATDQGPHRGYLAATLAPVNGVAATVVVRAGKGAAVLWRGAGAGG
jgi:hypothetical protein